MSCLLCRRKRGKILDLTRGLTETEMGAGLDAWLIGVLFPEAHPPGLCLLIIDMPDPSRTRLQPITLVLFRDFFPTVIWSSRSLCKLLLSWVAVVCSACGIHGPLREILFWNSRKWKLLLHRKHPWSPCPSRRRSSVLYWYICAMPEAVYVRLSFISWKRSHEFILRTMSLNVYSLHNRH